MGGDQGTAEMPTLPELYLDHALGVLVPSPALGTGTERDDCIPPLHPAELGCLLHHTSCADDIILLAASAETLTKMTSELMPALKKTTLQVKREKAARYWSVYRPSVITVADHKLQAERIRPSSASVPLREGTPK